LHTKELQDFSEVIRINQLPLSATRLKNDQNDHVNNNSATSKAREKIIRDLESIEF
jgi:hypothetical protein